MALAIDPAILAPDPAFYQAQVAVLESRATGTFNIGSGTTHSVNEIIALVREQAAQARPPKA